ncbi:hypothetical protein B5807_09373 [Epicoccum nigrum]|uniref:Methyltransferase domain-containing protein n=1 Tax=Epicoccum nigrum TaxID=105696 RepID=A0A1Y2LQJ8_EPING|nr:hypothetical protein B5807_09373 [Epicoccum nigrum]
MLVFLNDRVNNYSHNQNFTMSTALTETRPAKSSEDSNIAINEADARTFHNTDAAYVLPNDNIEHQRLELQSRLLYRLMGSKVFHSPLDRSEIHKTLDIGCGTGAVTHEMASMFPDAQVLGADLSPVPGVRQKLPNISYVQGNIMELEDALFERNSFDLIFSRLLVLGMPNWKAYVERCVALAKPGGWVEMHDLSTKIQHILPHISSFEHFRPHSITINEIANSSHPTDSYYSPSAFIWDSILNKLLALKDVDSYCGSNIGSLFTDAGLTDIHIKRYMFPFGTWDELTGEERGTADYMGTSWKEVLPVLFKKAGENAGPEYAEDVVKAIRDVKKFYESYEGGRNFLWMYVVCGRKPE